MLRPISGPLGRGRGIIRCARGRGTAAFGKMSHLHATVKAWILSQSFWPF
jgi:hypothetical protein